MISFSLNFLRWGGYSCAEQITHARLPLPTVAFREWGGGVAGQGHRTWDCRIAIRRAIN
jgi:hypothetical protein